MATGSAAANAVDTRAAHAAIAPADCLLDERRTLYGLAVDLLLSDNRVSLASLDSPLVRFRLGKALAGIATVEERDLEDACDVVPVEGGLRVVADPSADLLLTDVVDIIAPAGPRPGFLTRADGSRFEAAVRLVDEGVRLAREIDSALVDDLLAHIDLVAVLDAGTANGLVSASSRYVPGLVVIDEPSSPMQVAEALVHEGAHEKFFDLAITRSFLDVRAESVEYFETSWSRKRWPLEQTFAAWHAYRLLAAFSVSCGSMRLPSGSLLPEARERAAEIGSWLRDHDHYLGLDALRLLGALHGGEPGPGVTSNVDWSCRAPEVNSTGHFRVLPGVRMRRAALTGRVVVAKAGQPADLFWLDEDSSLVLDQINRNDRGALAFADMLAHLTGIWGVDDVVAQRRLLTVLTALVESSIVEPDRQVSLESQEG